MSEWINDFYLALDFVVLKSIQAALRNKKEMIIIHYILFETHRILKGWYSYTGSGAIVLTPLLVVFIFGASFLMYLYHICRILPLNISDFYSFRLAVYATIILVYGLISLIYLYEKKYLKIHQKFSELNFLLPKYIRTILILLFYVLPFFNFFS